LTHFQLLPPKPSIHRVPLAEAEWTNGGDDTGRTQDDPNQPTFANRAYDVPTGETHLVGYHVTAEYVEPFYAGSWEDPNWADYEPVYDA
jgi:hypothetical protein